MRIIDLKVNHLTNPLGFQLSNKQTFTYKVLDTAATKLVATQIQVATSESFDEIIFDSGKDESVDILAFTAMLNLLPRTRYFWRVTIWSNNGEVSVSDTAWFETAKLNEVWTAKWITPELTPNIHPVLSKEITISKKVTHARVYICGLGLYELSINNQKVGNEFLAPFNNDYGNFIQYQTYDITNEFVEGNNLFEVILGNGWYKGNFGFDGGQENMYGDKFVLLAEFHLNYEDGTSEVVHTDTSWIAKKGKVLESGIYLGEVHDDTFFEENVYGVFEIELGFDLLEARRSLPVIVKEKFKTKEIIITPAGETVIDVGQNLVGWLEFTNTLPKDTEITFQFGEILQDGNFYRENLRDAEAKFVYTSNGEDKLVRPHFTFYGFRYVKVTGWPKELNINDFDVCVVYSDIEHTGYIETSNKKVNQLISNVLWGQKGNFLDIPTDCPQRDERMGWTGDAQVFAGTAAFNMDVYAFFSKYGYDLWLEQKVRNGAVPNTVPDVPDKFKPESSSSAWGDAATVIPWTMYIYYGDKSILEQQFESMKSWVDYIKGFDELGGSQRLWRNGFHFGDWLALDAENTNSPIPVGKTDRHFIASAYYYYSSTLVAKAATVIGKEEEAKKYADLAAEIRQSIQNEYISPNGKLTIDTQTAYIVALYMDLVDEELKQRVADDLAGRLVKDDKHLKTGFVGTPYICQVLSKYGYNDLAYTLLLNEDYPSWLYQVNLGATTIWERWNSVLPDGSMNPEGMNSLNHYAYGSIMEWMYRYMIGIQPVESTPGFKKVLIAPKPHWRMKWAKGEYNSVNGLYKVDWKIQDNGQLAVNIEVPFNTSATLILPDATTESIKVLSGQNVSRINQDGNVVFEIESGIWNFIYQPTTDYIKVFNRETTLKKLYDTPVVKEIILKEIPELNRIPGFLLHKHENRILKDVVGDFGVSEEVLEQVEKLILEVI